MKCIDRHPTARAALVALLIPLLAGIAGCIDEGGGTGGGGAGGGQGGAAGGQTGNGGQGGPEGGQTGDGGQGGAETGGGGDQGGAGGATMGAGGAASCDNTGDCGDGTLTSACVLCDVTGCMGCALANNCSDEHALCLAEQQCVDIVDCLQVCGDAECIYGCADQFPTGWPLYEDIVVCIRCEECVLDCNSEQTGC